MNRRLAGAATLAIVMFVFVRLAPGPFVGVMVAALLIAPLFPWRAFFRLHAKVRLEERTMMPGAPATVSLRTARNGMLLKAIGTTVTAALALFVAGRELGIVGQMERTDFLFLIAFPPLLSVGPAIDWILTVGRLDR